MNKILATSLLIIGLLGCKKSTPPVIPTTKPTTKPTAELPQVFTCPTVISPADQAAILFIKEVDETVGSRKLDKDIYLNEVVGSWKFIYSQYTTMRPYCTAYYHADSVRNIVFNFKADFTYTFSNADSIHFTRKMSGHGKLNSLFRSQYIDPYVAFYIDAAPKGDKIRINFHSNVYATSYFKKL